MLFWWGYIVVFYAIASSPSFDIHPCRVHIEWSWSLSLSYQSIESAGQSLTLNVLVYCGIIFVFSILSRISVALFNYTVHSSNKKAYEKVINNNYQKTRRLHTEYGHTVTSASVASGQGNKRKISNRNLLSLWAYMVMCTCIIWETRANFARHSEYWFFLSFSWSLFLWWLSAQLALTRHTHTHTLRHTYWF